MTEDTIISYFMQIEQKGWGLREKPTVELWHLVYESYPTEFDVYLSVTDEWVYFQAPLLKPGAMINPQCREALFAYLLRLNSEIHLVKFSLDLDEQVVLSIEIPSESFDFKAFRNVTEALETYLDRYFTEISIVAHQPELANLTQLGELEIKEEEEIEINIL
jgi:hypothetical protein